MLSDKKRKRKRWREFFLVHVFALGYCASETCFYQNTNRLFDSIWQFAYIESRKTCIETCLASFLLSLSFLGIFSIYTQRWSLLLLLLLLLLSSRIESIFRSIRLRLVFSVVNFIITLDKILIENKKKQFSSKHVRRQKRKSNHAKENNIFSMVNFF